MKARALAALSLAAVLAACASRTPVPAVTAPGQTGWDAISATNYTCTPAQTVNVAFDDVARAPEHYFEKCVRLRALFSDGKLYRDATALKAESTSIGVSIKDGRLPDALRSHPQFVVAAGRLRSCIELFRQLNAQSEPPNVVAIDFIDGFCGDLNGSQLFVTVLRPIPTAMD